MNNNEVMLVEAKERSRLYYQENIERIKEQRKIHRQNNKEKEAERKRKWKEANPDKVALQQKRNRKRHPTKVRADKLKYESRKRGLVSNITALELSCINSYFDESCALTGDKENLHYDHFISLSTGHKGTTKGNIIPLSAKLNGSKSSKNPFEWAKEQKIDKKKFKRLVEFLAKENDMTVKEYTAYVYWCYENPL